MLIKDFGHLWERKFTNYGRGGVKGHLRGYVNLSKVVDFREGEENIPASRLTPASACNLADGY